MTLECIWSIIFIIVSVFLLAYVIGSTTLAIIKGDERVGKYRERMHALMAYSKLNDLPPVRARAVQHSTLWGGCVPPKGCHFAFSPRSWITTDRFATTCKPTATM